MSRGARLIVLAVAVVTLGAPGARAEAPADPGVRAFQKCYACHSVDPAERKLSGPNLAGIVGRRAATVADFEYSDAMIDARDKRRLVWTREALDRFLADPEDFIPGNAMNFFGMRSAEERAALIAYLKEQGRR